MVLRTHSVLCHCPRGRFPNSAPCDSNTSIPMVASLRAYVFTTKTCLRSSKKIRSLYNISSRPAKIAGCANSRLCKCRRIRAVYRVQARHTNNNKLHFSVKMFTFYYSVLQLCMWLSEALLLVHTCTYMFPYFLAQWNKQSAFPSFLRDIRLQQMLFCSYTLTQWHIKNAYFPFSFLPAGVGFNATFLLPLTRCRLQATSLLPGIEAQATTRTLFHPSWSYSPCKPPEC